MSGLPTQPAWTDEAEKRLRHHSVNVEEYPGKTFRPAFFRTIGHIYWEHLVAVTERDRLDDIELADRLGHDKSTVSRWTSGKHPPAADKFFAVVLLVLKRDLKDLALGSQNDLLFDAIRRQFELLAEEYDEPPGCPLSRFVLKSLLRVMLVPAVNNLVPGATVTEQERKSALRTATAGLNAALKRDFEAEVARSQNFAGTFRTVKPSELDGWLAGWGIPYTLFALGCTRNWGIDHV